ncbi:MAG: alpha-N-arabinofuranosidase [Candidatus Jordarchaeum sp.]|uniref:alpha-N-arabinofuranosidase n=1 Tax=Candidatus Jordarchaeum sp. TaxID=2823881 RepID=UPI00404B9B6D
MPRASVAVFPVKILGKIDSRIYGHFIEHLGRCIYGGIWNLEKNDFNERIIERITDLKPLIIRWPGGCFSDNYHWMDGVGPVEQRPVRENLPWSLLGPEFGPSETNRFGTDEFIKFCRRVGAEPYINVNVGSGTPEEAANWLEYCNGSIETELGSLRAKYGNRKPYKVKFWGIGNELYGTWETGHMSAEEYAQKFMEYHDAMKKVDSKIELVAVGADQRYPDWTKTVLEKAGKYIDYLSIHLYFTGVLPEEGGSEIKEDTKSYRRIIASSYKFQEILEWVRETIESVMGKNHGIKIAFDEWNLWWDFSQLLHANYCLRDGLWAASVLNKIIKMSNIVKMANIAQLINTLGVIQTNGDDVFNTAIYEVIKLYRENTQKNAISTEISSPKFLFEPLGILKDRREIPYIDGAATVSEDNKNLTVFLVNFHPKKDLPIEVEIPKLRSYEKLIIKEINGPSIHAKNDYQKNEITLSQREFHQLPEKIEYALPAHSISVMILTKT